MTKAGLITLLHVRLGPGTLLTITYSHNTTSLPYPYQVDEKPTEEYSDVGGCDKQIQELVEAVVLPMTHGDRFKALGIRPPKGVLLHGPPGEGDTVHFLFACRS